MINFMLCFLSQFFKATRHKQVSDIHEVMKSEFIVLKYGQDSEMKKGGKSRQKTQPIQRYLEENSKNSGEKANKSSVAPMKLEKQTEDRLGRQSYSEK